MRRFPKKILRPGRKKRSLNTKKDQNLDIHHD